MNHLRNIFFISKWQYFFLQIWTLYKFRNDGICWDLYHAKHLPRLFFWRDPFFNLHYTLVQCLGSTQLGGGFKCSLFSPRFLGKWSNLTGIFFRWVENHQLDSLKLTVRTCQEAIPKGKDSLATIHFQVLRWTCFNHFVCLLPFANGIMFTYFRPQAWF